MFKVGDIVEITEESSATGVLDFIDGKGYMVEAVYDTTNAVMLLNESRIARWYHYAHFKLKEKSEVGKKECLFKVGQVVWDVRVGKGKVDYVYEFSGYPTVVKVLFDDGNSCFYTKDGKLLETDIIRSLYFSEPKIEAATEPVFEPILEAGMTLCAVDKETSRFCSVIVREETEEDIESVHGVVFEKTLHDFYRLGEKIEFH